jgi:L-malate glycosyltransferase
LGKIRVLNLIKGLNRGGAETLLSDGVRQIDRERFEVSYGYFHPTLDALVPALRASGAGVTCFGGTNHATMLLRARRIARHLREQQIDLVHCHLPTAGAVGRLAGRIAGVPVVYTEHNMVEWYHPLTFWMNAWSYEWQDHVIAVSDRVRQSIITCIRPRVPVTVVRNGIDSAYFTRFPQRQGSVREQCGIPGDAPVVGNVAAFIPQKRVMDWVAAARLLHQDHPQVHFIWVGEGPLRSLMVRAVSDAGLTSVVHLAGVQADVRPFLAAMDIYMMSSAFEGLPVALLEAMAMGCAPVCTAVGGIPEVIRQGENGFLTVSGQPEQLAAAVSRLVVNPERARVVAEAARSTIVSEFDASNMVRAVEQIYLDVLARRAPPAAGHPRVREEAAVQDPEAR